MGRRKGPIVTLSFEALKTLNFRGKSKQFREITNLNDLKNSITQKKKK